MMKRRTKQLWVGCLSFLLAVTIMAQAISVIPLDFQTGNGKTSQPSDGGPMTPGELSFSSACLGCGNAAELLDRSTRVSRSIRILPNLRPEMEARLSASIAASNHTYQSCELLRSFRTSGKHFPLRQGGSDSEGDSHHSA